MKLSSVTSKRGVGEINIQGLLLMRVNHACALFVITEATVFYVSYTLNRPSLFFTTYLPLFLEVVNKTFFVVIREKLLSIFGANSVI